METLTLILLFVLGSLTGTPAPQTPTSALFALTNQEESILNLRFSPDPEFKVRYSEPPLLSSSVAQVPFGTRNYILPEFLWVAQGDLRSNPSFSIEHRSHPWSIGVNSYLAPWNTPLSVQGLSLGLALNNTLDLSGEWRFKGEGLELRLGLQFRF